MQKSSQITALSPGPGGVNKYFCVILPIATSPGFAIMASPTEGKRQRRQEKMLIFTLDNFRRVCDNTFNGWGNTNQNQNQKGNIAMSDYTKEMESVIRNSAPLTFERAQEIAASDAFVEAGKTHRSVIAKAKSMGVEYVAKQKPLKRAKGVTKSDLVMQIAVALGTDSEYLTGLDKANTAALSHILERVA